MNTKNTQDPWLGGQKQIKFPVPGWIVFLVKAPFRLLFGLLGAAGKIDDNREYRSSGKDFDIDYRYNWDGTNNMDGDTMSTDEHKK